MYLRYRVAREDQGPKAARAPRDRTGAGFGYHSCRSGTWPGV
jgi:hypothetical protein